MSYSLKPEFSNVFQLVFIVIKKYDKLLDNNSMYILFIQSCIITHVLDPENMLFFNGLYCYVPVQHMYPLSGRPGETVMMIE